MAEIEFAAWMTMNRAKLEMLEHYEVRPCRKVRGFMLRLPGIGWRFWFSTVAKAVNFAHRVESVYEADCFVYDSSGQTMN
jgi:hypothetical protein